MSNINFVPDDYIQKKESSRANWMYLFLCLIMLSALGGTFGIIKIRQARIDKQSSIIAEKMAQAKKDIEQLEKLQSKRKSMMQTALTAVNLLETVPRSVIIATITNNLPSQTSVIKATLSQKASREASSIYTGTYKKAAGKKDTAKQDNTFIEIEGIAPTDKQVASFIANLDSCSLFDGIDLIYTKEYKKDKKDTNSARRFKISTKIKQGTVITKQFLDMIKYDGV